MRSKCRCDTAKQWVAAYGRGIDTAGLHPGAIVLHHQMSLAQAFGLDFGAEMLLRCLQHSVSGPVPMIGLLKRP